jgi:hypothetical protein
MRSTEQLGRYRLLDLVAADPSDHGEVLLWHAYDQILDRPVAVRVLPADDSRCAAVLGAAQAAARVDDRRLLRVLDILDLSATATDPARVAVVSEWASGRNLEGTLADRKGTPFGAADALALVADVARAIAAGLADNVEHGRLRPSSVFITDAGEVRIRGLAVDAALFGTQPGVVSGSTRSVDVDALGSLTYLLTTGYWPGEGTVNAPAAPRKGAVVLPPSQVRAAVPRSIDDVVARSVESAARPRGVARVPDSAAFATMVGAALDHLAPVATTTMRLPARRTRAGTAVRWSLRIVGAVAAVVLVGAIAWLGWSMTTSGVPTTAGPTSTALDPMLTSPAKPVDELAGSGIERTYPIQKFRSYDPFGDDDGNGKPDKRKGRENDELAATVNDEDPDTAWLTSQYSSADLDGKEGTGLILDLGSPQDIQQVSLNLVGKGSSIDVRVADAILPDPALWTELASGFATRDRIDVRSPRPVTGRYVLVWFTQVPPAETSGAGVYQGGIRSVVVSG